jgi:hypothetical protein
MTTPITEVTTMTLRAMRTKLDEAAAIARAAQGCAVDGQPRRALMIALDVEPLALEANQLLQGLAILRRWCGMGRTRQKASRVSRPWRSPCATKPTAASWVGWSI